MIRNRIKQYRQNTLRYLGSFNWWWMLRKARFSTLARAGLAVAEWRLHRAVCISRPFAFRLEPAAVCNLKCPLCSTTHREFIKDDARVMSLSTFKTIYAKIEHVAWRVTFYMEGEPMMNPHLFKMIGAVSRKAFTSFSTNLTL